MIVRYTRDRGYEGTGKDPYLTFGKDYVVFFIDFTAPSPMVAVLCPDGDAAMFDLRYFDILDSRIPPEWCFGRFGEGLHALMPEEYFFKSLNLYSDRNEVEDLIFQKLRRKLERFHGIEQDSS